MIYSINKNWGPRNIIPQKNYGRDQLAKAGAALLATLLTQ